MSQADTMQPKRSILALSLGISLSAFAAIVAAILFSGASADAATYSMTSSGGSWTTMTWSCTPGAPPDACNAYPGAVPNTPTDIANLNLCCAAVTVDAAVPQPVVLNIPNLGAPLQVNSAGSLILDAASSVGTFNTLIMNGGTLTNNAALALDANSTFLFHGGTLSGPGSTTFAGTLVNFDGTQGPMVIDGGQTLSVSTTITMSGTNPLNLNNGSTINVNNGGAAPDGIFNLASDAPILSSGTPGVINLLGGGFPPGTMQKVGGVGQTPIFPVVNNFGAIFLAVSGVSVALNGGGTHTGTFAFGPATSFVFGGNHFFQPGATFNAAGDVTITPGVFTINEPLTFPGNLINGGELQFGPSAATQAVTVNTNYTQTPTGILDVKLNGTTPGTTYDQLLAGGIVSLGGGTLNATLGFSPVVDGTTWDIINGKISLTGDFTIKNLPSYATGKIQEVTPTGPNDVFLVAVAQSDIGVTKGGPGSILDGQTADYTLTVTNYGPAAADVTVTDTFSGPATFKSVSSPNCAFIPPSTVSCTFLGMPAFTNQIIQLSLNSTGPGTITNNVTVSSPNPDPVPGNNSASLTTTVVVKADVSVTKTGPASALPGSNITYTITVTNNGPSDATGVVLNDAPSAGLTQVSVSGACSSFPCKLGTMTAGTSDTVQATYNISKGVTSVTNTAKVTSTSPDPTSGNNVASMTTNVGCSTSAPNNPFPVDGTTNVPTSGSLGWTNVGATTYNVYLGPVGNGCSTLFGTSNVSGLSYSGLISGSQYEWRIDAIEPGCPTTSSSCFKFTTGGCPGTPPTLIAPANGSTVTGLVTFSWNGVAGAVDYKVFAGVGAAAPTEVGTTTDTTLTTSIDAGQVSWYVVAEFAAPCPPVQSPTSSFNACGTSAPIPKLVSEVFTNQTYTFEWTPVNGATKYEVDEARDASFTQGLFTQTVNGTSVQFQHTVSAPTPFFYRVRAFESCSNGLGPNSKTVRIVLDLIPPPDQPNPNVNVPAGSTRVVVQIIHVPGFPDGTFPFAATVDKPWLQVSPSSGLLPPEGVDLTVTADPTSLPNGTQTGTVLVTIGSSSGPIRTNGTTTVSVPVSISLVTPVSPTKPVGEPPPNALIIAAVGHLDGINSRWQSDVSVSNIASSSAQYELTFTPDDPAKGVKQTIITAGAQATVALSDIVRNWYGVGSLGETANGVLEIRPLSGSGKTGSDQVNVSLTTVAASRTYNVTSNGTLGEFIPAIPFANFIGRVTDPGKLAPVLGLQQIAQSDNFRTNLGLVEAAGKPVSVLASVFDPSGKKVLDIPVDLKANEQRQLNSFLAQNKIALSNGRIEVKVTGGDGKVTAYASVVDNRSGDPYLVAPVALGQTSADTYVLPGVADVNTGLAAWRTDMTILNSGTVPQLATLTFYAQGSSDTPKSTSMTVNPGELKVLDNVLPSFLSTTNAGGAVHVTTPIPSSLVVAGHTYDLTTNGTKGQFIQAVTAIDAAGKGDRDLQILQVEDSSRYYTNIGIAEVTGKPVTVEVAVVLPDSKVSPKAQIALTANGFFQQDIIQAIGMSNVYNARVTVRVVDGDGKITAYGSVIDQKTKDATYVPAQ